MRGAFGCGAAAAAESPTCLVGAIDPDVDKG